MSLRLRLVVAFFLFSVVPLAAVTFYSYTGNLRALQVAAQHETEMLTGELTQRMQVVTTQVSDRVERLMDMPAAASPTAATGTSGTARASTTTSSTRTAVARATPAPAGARPAAPASPLLPLSPATVAAAAKIDASAMEARIAGALGEVAMLLNNVEVRGLGRLGGRGGAPPGTPQSPLPPGGRGTVPAGTAAAEAALRAGTIMMPPSNPSAQPDGRGRGSNVPAGGVCRTRRRRTARTASLWRRRTLRPCPGGSCGSGRGAWRAACAP